MSKSEIRNLIKEIAMFYNISLILYGAGYPVEEPNIVVIENDFLTTQKSGYNVFIYPEGEKPGEKSFYRFIG